MHLYSPSFRSYHLSQSAPASIPRRSFTGVTLIYMIRQYDYFWRNGRDMRGNNAFGKVLMNIRDKLRKEQAQGGTTVAPL